jgi:hypothetical protein
MFYNLPMQLREAADQFLLMTAIEGKNELLLRRYKLVLSAFCEFMGESIPAEKLKKSTIRHFVYYELACGRPARKYWPTLKTFLLWCELQGMVKPRRIRSRMAVPPMRVGRIQVKVYLN